MKIYIKYFWYVVEHKWNVFIECLKIIQPWHGVIHDLSKFLPSEFIPYAKFFMQTDRAKNYKKSDETNINFQKGWLFHQKRNKHHWNYWISITNNQEITPMPMPSKYVEQMIADWRGMSRKFGGSATKYYLSHKDGMMLHPETIEIIEFILDV